MHEETIDPGKHIITDTNVPIMLVISVRGEHDITCEMCLGHTLLGETYITVTLVCENRFK